jgi:hypothetical protein
MSDKDYPIRALYSVALQEARSSGDVNQMEALARRAEQEGAGDPDIQRALAEVRAELAKQRGGGSGNYPRPLYAEALNAARASGDVEQMRQLAERARTEGADDPEIQSALSAVQAEIDKAGNG